VIFVTVGTQLAFDRMMRVVDAWAASAGRDDVFAQVGPDAWKPSHIGWSEFVTPEEFDRRCGEADVIIGHAGMGSILTGLRFGKPVLIMPRKAALREQRNDHQSATAQRFKDRDGIYVALDENELASLLTGIDTLKAESRIGPYASDRLIETLRAFINQPAVRAAASREHA